MRRAAIAALPVVLSVAGCSHPLSHDLTVYMATDSSYAALPAGPARIDALWLYVKQAAGTEEEALRVLGSLSVSEGIRLRHPFDTGLTPTGVLAPIDKTGHFFAHAMWQYEDEGRPIPIARAFGVAWEVFGEVKSWFVGGDGYDLDDVWANRVGREFGRRLWAHHRMGRAKVMPSDIIGDAQALRPTRSPTSSMHGRGASHVTSRR